MVCRMGDSLHNFMLCVRQHAVDRDLEQQLGHSPNYWVCMAAKNHHEHAEETVDSEAGAASARSFCMGTLSVIDLRGVYFSRIWCELPRTLESELVVLRVDSQVFTR